MKIENIKITEFAKRHFDKKFGGTKVLDFTIERFERYLNEINTSSPEMNGFYVKIIPGYADFCKLLIVENFTNAKTGSLPITLENYQYLRSGYSSRTPDEIPVMSRWFELPISAPKASFLCLVLYSKEQLEKEATSLYTFEGDYGVVAILGQMSSEEEPMKPETMIRNYMPIEFGGSGMEFPINPGDESSDELKGKYFDDMNKFKKEYQRCVDFWKDNATVK